jgi:hypothetical protein
VIAMRVDGSRTVGDRSFCRLLGIESQASGVRLKSQASGRGQGLSPARGG